MQGAQQQESQNEIPQNGYCVRVELLLNSVNMALSTGHCHQQLKRIGHIHGDNPPVQYIQKGSSSCSLRQPYVMNQSKADKDNLEICFKTLHQIPTENTNED